MTAMLTLHIKALWFIGLCKERDRFHGTFVKHPQRKSLKELTFSRGLSLCISCISLLRCCMVWEIFFFVCFSFCNPMLTVNMFSHVDKTRKGIWDSVPKLYEGDLEEQDGLFLWSTCLLGVPRPISSQESAADYCLRGRFSIRRHSWGWISTDKHLLMQWEGTEES